MRKLPKFLEPQEMYTLEQLCDEYPTHTVLYEHEKQEEKKIAIAFDEIAEAMHIYDRGDTSELRDKWFLILSMDIVDGDMDDVRIGVDYAVKHMFGDGWSSEGIFE